MDPTSKPEAREVAEEIAEMLDKEEHGGARPSTVAIIEREVAPYVDSSRVLLQCRGLLKEAEAIIDALEAERDAAATQVVEALDQRDTLDKQWKKNWALAVETATRLYKEREALRAELEDLRDGAREVLEP